MGVPLKVYETEIKCQRCGALPYVFEMNKEEKKYIDGKLFCLNCNHEIYYTVTQKWLESKKPKVIESRV